MKNPSGKLSRWLIKLRQHTFDLEHRKGALNVVPDALSRIPYSSDPDTPDVNNLSSYSTSGKIEVSVLSFDPSSVDSWYSSLRNKILEFPEKFPQWKVENHLIHKFIPMKSFYNFNNREWKILVPKVNRQEVLQSCHNPPTMAHFGFRKTLYRTQESYYWPHMRSDILKFVRKCLVCGAQKHSNRAKTGFMGKEKVADRPFQIVALDLIGPFPRSKKGNKFLLVIADWFSKFTLIFPLRHSKSPAIVKYLKDEIFLNYGVPEYLICDNAPNLVSSSFKSICKDFGVKIWYTPVYSPQCNFVERINKTIGTALRCYIEKHEEWDLHIAEIRQAINTSVHEVTGFPPSYLNFARHIPLSGNFYSDRPDDEKVQILPGDRNTYAQDFADFRNLFSEVRNKLHSAYERNSKSYNLRRRPLNFKVGDRVWRPNKVQSSAANKFAAKLSPKHILSIVVKKLSPTAYVLKNIDGSKAGTWHIKDLLPCADNSSEISESDVASDSEA